MIAKFRAYIKRNPARVYAFCFALAAFAARLYPSIPVEAVVVVFLAFLGIGNGVQRLEDKKTLEALYKMPPPSDQQNV